jgi:hypothetical protein
VNVFMTFWLGFCALWTLLAAISAFAKPEAWFFPLVGVGMFAAGVAFVRFCQWLARNDEAWLANVIRQALSSNGA